MSDSETEEEGGIDSAAFVGIASLICSTTFSLAWTVSLTTFSATPLIWMFEGRVGTGGILEEAGPIEDASLSSPFPFRFDEDCLRSFAL